MARQPKYKQQPKYLVVCEDSKSSKDYLQEAANYFRVNTYVEIVHLDCTDPSNIVDKAITKIGSFESIFCVIDRDNHANFDAAMALANGHGNINMIVSYPCYEFWFCLHMGYKRKPYSRAGKKSAADRLIDDLTSLDKLFINYKKGGTKGLFTLIINQHRKKYDDAHTYADRILEEINTDGEKNPRTKIHELLRHIESLADPQPLE